jgi:hypothetical protein
MADEQPERPEGYHEDQLLQGTYPPYDRVIHGPPGTDIGSLWIAVVADEENHVVTMSSWDLDDRQRAMIAAGAHIRLSQWTYPIPPVSVAVEAPFCECHDAEMTFDPDQGGFHCPHIESAGGSDADDSTASSAEEQLRRDFSPAPDDDEAPEGGDLG